MLDTQSYTHLNLQIVKTAQYESANILKNMHKNLTCIDTTKKLLDFNIETSFQNLNNLKAAGQYDNNNR